MTLRRLSKVASIGMAVLGLVVVPPLRAFQAEDATKAVTKKARKSAKDATSNAASSDTNTNQQAGRKDVLCRYGAEGQACAGKHPFSIRNLGRQG
jgi:hypothetical protein